VDDVEVTKALGVPEGYNIPSTSLERKGLRPLDLALELWVALDVFAFPIIVVAHNPRLFCMAQRGFKWFENLLIKAQSVALIAPHWLVERFAAIVVADFGVVKLVASEYEASGPHRFDEGEHGREGWLRVCGKV
jgi:hypothetical protein